MNTHNPKWTTWVKRISGSFIAVMLAISSGGQAHARILFEDDDYFNVQSEGIILDFNDNITPGTESTASADGGTYTAVAAGVAGDSIDIVIVDGAACDIITTPGGCTAVVGDVITITADLSDADAATSGAANAITSADIVAEINAYAPAAALVTATAGTGASASAGTINLASGADGGDVKLQFGGDGSNALISYNDSTEDITLSTPGGDFDFSDDNLTTTGGALFSGSSEFHIREVADETTAACTTVDEIVLDTTENRIYVCTAIGAPGTWTAADSSSSQDFDDTYDISQSGGNLTMEIDNGSLNFNITTADSFTIQDGGAAIGEFTGAGAVLFDPTNGQNFDVTTLGVGDIVLNSADDINVDGATFNLDTTSTFSLDGVGASNVTTDTGNLALSTTTSGDVDITGATNVDIAATAGDVTLTSGDDIIFDDVNLTGIVQLTDGAGTTDWAATFSTDGIIDNINAFTLTTNGNGASNVGIEDASTWFTGTEIETALNEMEALFGSTTSSTFDFTEDNVLANNDAVYAALDKLDLKWGDLANTANGEGASLVGIEDAGGYFTLTTVEGALQELGADVGKNFEDLTFYPEFPDATVFQDGSNNKGTLEGLYDDTEKTGYYSWATKNPAVQDIDVRFQFPLPTDFSATGDFTYRYRSGTATEAENDLEIRLYEIASTSETLCGSDVAGNFGTSWATGTIAAGSITGCTLAAGDIVEVRIKFFADNTVNAQADLGEITWNYTK